MDHATQWTVFVTENVKYRERKCFSCQCRRTAEWWWRRGCVYGNKCLDSESSVDKKIENVSILYI